MNLIDKCVYVGWFTHSLFPGPSLLPSSFLRHKHIGVWVIAHSGLWLLKQKKRESHIAHSWSKSRLHSEDGLSNTEADWTLGLWHQIISHSLNAKGRFFKKIGSSTPVSMWKIEKPDNFIGEVLVVGMENQRPQHSLHPKSKAEQALVLLSSVKEKKKGCYTRG